MRNAYLGGKNFDTFLTFLGGGKIYQVVNKRSIVVTTNILRFLFFAIS